MSETRSRTILTTLALTFIASLAAGAAPVYRIETSAAVWEGDMHARAHATVTLRRAGGEAVWTVPGIAESHASDDGATVALVTRSHELLISQPPAAPRPVAGAFLTARCSPDGRFVAAHVIGGEGDTMLRILEGRGIALVDARSLRSQLVLAGSDLYAPSFADEGRLFFGSGAGERVASLWILDIAPGLVARITNRDPAPGVAGGDRGMLEPFPDAAPTLDGESVRYVSEGRELRAPLPDPTAFAPAIRFDPRVSQVAAPPPRASFGHVKLRTPTTAASPCTIGGSSVGQYFDLDRRMGFRADWACGGLTYDGHRGTDYCQPCGNAVAAPATGFVIEWYDGCPNFGNWGNGCGYGWGNHVAIMHDDGTVSLEAHGKAGTVVRAGTIACGGTLMLSCSSGNSTGPHIHHENWVDANGYWDPRKAFDPYRGSCDPLDATKWKTQGAYRGLPGALCN